MPLKIVVVGAGLAGLGAAIALNRQGHDIEVCQYGLKLSLNSQ